MTARTEALLHRIIRAAHEAADWLVYRGKRNAAWAVLNEALKWEISMQRERRRWLAV